MVDKTSHYIEIRTPNDEPSEDAGLRLILLDDGRLIPVETGGMVDIAMKELGAKIVEIDRIETDTDPCAA
jgi:hypothetical protein